MKRKGKQMLTHSNRRTKMNRGWIIIFVIAITALLLIGCSSTQKPKVYHVGILSGLDFFANTADGFKTEMANLGYIEGENIIYDMQKTNFEPDKEEQIFKKFIADKVDLIFVFPTEVAAAAKVVTQGTGIPVLFANANIEGIDLVNSVREPGGNVTGVRFPGPDLALKRFDILRELAPDAKRYYLPYQKGYLNVEPQLEALRPQAEAAGITLIETPLSTAADIEADLASRVNGDDPGMDAILVVAEPLSVTPDLISIIGKFAYEYKIPFGGSASMGDYPTPFGVFTDNVNVGKQAAPLADKILKGIEAGTIPVLSAENFLQINLEAARQLDMELPEGLISQANQILE
jgi:putative ABC transport system substrate-binding protein